MNIDFYKEVVRNFNISDDMLTELIKTAISDIAISTGFFRKKVNFQIYRDTDLLDFESLFYINEALEQKVTNITVSSNPSDESLLDEILKNDIPIGSDVNITYETEDDNNFDTLLELIDVCIVKTIDDNSDTNYSIFSFLNRIRDNVYELKSNFFETIDDSFIYRSDTSEYIVSYFTCTIIPDINSITDKDEMIIRSALTNYLLLKLNEIHNSQTDIQLTSQYFSIYENELRKIINYKVYHDNKINIMKNNFYLL